MEKIVILAWALLIAMSAQTLTPEQILTPKCREDLSLCAQQPAFQFYLGGLLDAVAYISQDLENGTRLYCVDESNLFDHEKILRFIAQQNSAMWSRNTTAAVVKYLSEFGGCLE